MFNLLKNRISPVLKSKSSSPCHPLPHDMTSSLNKFKKGIEYVNFNNLTEYLLHNRN